MRDGPHRVVNRLALDAFWRGASSDPVLARYDRGRNRKLTGEPVVAGAMLKPTDGDFKGTWEEWVAEGGYLADEPELYASFRDFYDPLALNAEVDAAEARILHPEVGLRRGPAAHGVPYLTDHLNVLTAIWSRPVGGTFNPQVHAKEWALEGPANNGWGDKPYCWKNGLEQMEQAFAATGPEKQRLFAKAWRSLGETMHLLADRTSPPHVRNDSHPGASTYLREESDDVGLLRSDPYETLARDGLILRAARAAPSPLDVSSLDANALFDAIAGFTNREVFSADTISGTDGLLRVMTYPKECGTRTLLNPLWNRSLRGVRS